MKQSFLLLLALGAGACKTEPEKTPAPPVAVSTGAPRSPNFELDCAPSNTSNAAVLFCVRTDTRSGEVLNVNIFALPVSTGSTRVGDGPAGRFTTICDATSTDTHSDFYCVRMNTESGEMVMVNLQKIGSIPSAPPAIPNSQGTGGFSTSAKPSAESTTR
jgi:hypothetical protein